MRLAITSESQNIQISRLQKSYTSSWNFIYSENVMFDCEYVKCHCRLIVFLCWLVALELHVAQSYFILKYFLGNTMFEINSLSTQNTRMACLIFSFVFDINSYAFFIFSYVTIYFYCVIKDEASKPSTIDSQSTFFVSTLL